MKPTTYLCNMNMIKTYKIRTITELLTKRVSVLFNNWFYLFQRSYLVEIERLTPTPPPLTRSYTVIYNIFVVKNCLVAFVHRFFYFPSICIIPSSIPLQWSFFHRSGECAGVLVSTCNGRNYRYKPHNPVTDT